MLFDLVMMLSLLLTFGSHKIVSCAPGGKLRALVHGSLTRPSSLEATKGCCSSQQHERDMAFTSSASRMECPCDGLHVCPRTQYISTMKCLPPETITLSSNGLRVYDQHLLLVLFFLQSYK